MQKNHPVSLAAESVIQPPRVISPPRFKPALARLLRLLAPWLLPIVLLIVWHLSSLNEASRSILPSPLEVVTRAITSLENGDLAESMYVSARRAIAGFLLGGSIGFVLGLLNGVSRRAEITLSTTINMVHNIPVLAVISLFIVWFGIGEEVKIAMVAFGVFFPVYVNTFHGIRNIDRGLLEMGKVYGFTPLQMFRDIIFPGALPSILVGVRLSLSIMWLVLIAAETIASDAGIGYMAITGRELMQMDKVVLSIIIYALLGKLSDVIASSLMRRVLRWRNQ
ncbi:ABC transporter permease subunit [Erwinia sp. JUb26]|uniref:ABC transporter permease subunit n=1 Tax=Erwinia sp. JUb26 TaxID=2485126 RepID=UPI000FBDD045|nr:ABC transporter permease subunit [Erwinia sp. JUb26]ROR09916.1 sulfonate transport system permease protein [Erwinia sp. JUb26]